MEITWIQAFYNFKGQKRWELIANVAIHHIYDVLSLASSHRHASNYMHNPVIWALNWIQASVTEAQFSQALVLPSSPCNLLLLASLLRRIGGPSENVWKVM